MHLRITDILQPTQMEKLLNYILTETLTLTPASSWCLLLKTLGSLVSALAVGDVNNEASIAERGFRIIVHHQGENSNVTSTAHHLIGICKETHISVKHTVSAVLHLRNVDTVHRGPKWLYANRTETQAVSEITHYSLHSALHSDYVIL